MSWARLPLRTGLFTHMIASRDSARNATPPRAAPLPSQKTRASSRFSEGRSPRRYWSTCNTPMRYMAIMATCPPGKGSAASMHQHHIARCTVDGSSGMATRPVRQKFLRTAELASSRGRRFAACGIEPHVPMKLLGRRAEALPARPCMACRIQYRATLLQPQRARHGRICSTEAEYGRERFCFLTHCAAHPRQGRRFLNFRHLLERRLPRGSRNLELARGEDRTHRRARSIEADRRAASWMRPSRARRYVVDEESRAGLRAFRTVRIRFPRRGNSGSSRMKLHIGDDSGYWTGRDQRARSRVRTCRTCLRRIAC